jgi:transposase-like protein
MTAERPSFWSQERDAELLRLLEAKWSFAQIADAIGCTKNMAIGRYHRVNKTEFRCDKRKVTLAGLKIMRAAAARNARIGAIKSERAAGKTRNEIIKWAATKQIPMSLVAEALDVSRQYVSQVRHKLRSSSRIRHIVSDAMIVEMKSYFEGGISKSEIARIFGIHRSTVFYYLDSKRKKNKNEYARAYKREMMTEEQREAHKIRMREYMRNKRAI